jgi:hypothetical protein
MPWFRLQQTADVEKPFYYRVLFKDGVTPSSTGWNMLGTTAEIPWDE